MKKQPVNLNLMTIKFPPMAIVSILHRLSGVLLFLFIPLVLYLLNHSLVSSSDFYRLKGLFTGSMMKLVIWILLAAFIYHLFAGVRHLLMDMGWGENLSTGHKNSWAVIILSIIASVLLGIWLW